MSEDYKHRLRELAEDFRQEAARIQIVGRALTHEEMRRADALRRARDLVLQALDELESAPPAENEGQGSVPRGDEDLHPRMDHERSGPVENTALAGDDDTPGYGRRDFSGDDDTRGYGRGGVRG
jgi:hypothetical protein